MSENTQPATIERPQPPANPFERRQSEHASVGAVAVESERAIAEAQAKLVIAKRFPRDQHDAVQRIIDACSRESLAGEAFYSYNRGGSAVTGPSIRLAEVLASCWGNVEYGINELSRKDGESEMQAYCWDLETNTYSQQKFTVAHVRDKRGGGQALTEQRDIYEIGANMGARRLRARILAIIPKDVVDVAEATCKATIAGKGQASLDARLKKMVVAFNALSVTKAMLETRLGHGIGETTVDELADLLAIYNTLKAGEAKAGDYFNGAQAQVAAPKEDEAQKPAKDAANLPQDGKAAAKDETDAKAAEEPKKGRPTKDELEQARKEGTREFHAGAPIEACPEERPSVMDAWREGWQSAHDAAAQASEDGSDDGDVPFDASEATGDDDGGEPAATITEPPADEGDDDEFSFGD